MTVALERQDGTAEVGTGAWTVLCVAARDGSARRTDAWDVHVRLRVLLPALAAADGRVGEWIGWREGVRPWRVAWLVLFVMWCNWTGVAGTLSFGTVILVSIQEQQQLEHERWDLVRQLLAMHTSKKGSSLFSTSPTMMWSFIVNCSLVTLSEMKWSMHTAACLILSSVKSYFLITKSHLSRRPSSARLYFDQNVL